MVPFSFIFRYFSQVNFTLFGNVCQVYRDTTVNVALRSTFVVLCEAWATFNLCFFKTKFHYVIEHQFIFFQNKISVRFFSKIKNLFHVLLTTSNQEFLDLRCQFLKTSFWQTALFSLIHSCLSSINFRDIKIIFEK